MGRKENEEYPAGRDAVAEALESAGLYRRAARRWLAARRSQCLENARKPEPATEYFEDVYRVASDTQKRMGIHAQNRFRRYPSDGESRKKSSC